MKSIAYVEAGVINSDFAQACLANKLTGAGWMNGLPGQVGGTARMNARCYGGEISQIVKKVHVVTRDGVAKTYTNMNVFRGYKDTVFMENGDLIVAVEVALREGDPVEVKKLMDFCEADRRSKGQFDHPSCGCVFKNDYSVGVPSGMLLDAAGAKKMNLPGVQINPHHANFLYNISATSRQILEATFRMRDLVYEAFGVWLAYEMEILGALSPDLRERVELAKPPRFNEAKLNEIRARFTARAPTYPSP